MTALKSTKPQAFGIGKAGMSAAKSALDYLIKVEGLKFVEAVQTLCEEKPQLCSACFPAGTAEGISFAAGSGK